MVLASDLVVAAEGEVYEELAEVSHVGMEISILKIQEVLKDHLVHNWALVAELLVQLGL